MKIKITTFDDYISYIRNNKNTPEEHSMMDSHETLLGEFHKYEKRNFIFLYSDATGKVTKVDK